MFVYGYSLVLVQYGRLMGAQLSATKLVCAISIKCKRVTVMSGSESRECPI